MRTYMGCNIVRTTSQNRNVVKWECYCKDRFIYSDTLQGMCEFIKHILKGGR